MEKLGLITNAGDEGEESDIQDVQNMVTSYMGGNTLILLTLTMRGENLTTHMLRETVLIIMFLDDINNQGALG